ncbi:MAG: DinB family protein [Chloroflexia bacterium]
MTTTTARTDQYAAQFEAINNEVIAIVEGCTDAQWQQPCVNEERPVGVVAHHIGVVHRDFLRIVERLASGQTFSPNMSMDVVHESNAQHARDHAEIGKQEVIDALRTNGATLAQSLRSLRDEQLDRVAGTFGGNELTVSQVLEWIVIGHATEHLGSIRSTVAA